VLAFDEKRGLDQDNIISLLASFREVVESAMSEEDYDNFSVHVYTIHNGDDPEFLCHLGTEELSEDEAQEVYEFLMEDPIDEYDIQS
jgi:hypothetical protein